MRQQHEESVCFILAVVFHSSLPIALSQAGQLPPPTGLSYLWLDPFTVNVFWQRPTQLLDGCVVQYRYGPHNSCTEWTNFTETLLTDEADSSGWNFKVRTEGLRNCGKSESLPANIAIVDTKEPRAQLVADFKCLHKAEMTDCSWLPRDTSVNLTLSYRICGSSPETIQSLKECERPYRNGARDGCYLSANFVAEDICMLLRSNASMQTFKPQRVVDPPKLHVSVEGDNLNVSWTPPEVFKDCSWTYELCYSKCDEPEKCQSSIPRGETRQIAYDRSCRYKFRSRVTIGNYCRKVQSDFGEVVVVDGEGKPDVSPTAVAIGVAVVLSVGVLLACYCFRRHSAVLLPVIPDPSGLLKDMMSGSTETKASTNLYTPVPEAIQPCRIMAPHETITPCKVIKHNRQDELPC
ncbi:uncharacterized protein LOC119128161 isoform X1 [Syngnathus acus]|uniref:uncharacterized protein LOC119128161 isoform X1 n=1 Tax=Syngnathus acus TaxID=161584 RepID=UPI001885F368|nr:uncharacterized protein LOC119128161 isoform X1 [Syngnathus acus]